MDRVGCSGLNKMELEADMKLSEARSHRGNAAPGGRCVLHYVVWDMIIETRTTITSTAHPTKARRFTTTR